MARNLQQVRARSAKNGSLRLDRHSGSGRLGSPKKGGAGTKFVWGVPGHNDNSSLAFVDKMDPNYDDGEEVIPLPSRKTDHKK